MQADTNSFPPLLLLLFPVFFVAVWMVACTAVSWASGWYALTRRFRNESEPLGETRTAGPFFYSIYMRFWGHYGSVVRVTVADDALYLSVLLPFRPGHPPLRIPWQEIRFGRDSFFWRKYIVLTLGTDEQIPFRISERMASKLDPWKRMRPENTLPSGPNFDDLGEVFVESMRGKPK